MANCPHGKQGGTITEVVHIDDVCRECSLIVKPPGQIVGGAWPPDPDQPLTRLPPLTGPPPPICTKCAPTMDDYSKEVVLKGHPSVSADGPDGLCAYHRRYAKAQEQDSWPGDDFTDDPDFWPGVKRRAEAIGNLPLAEVMKDEYKLDPEMPEEH